MVSACVTLDTAQQVVSTGRVTVIQTVLAPVGDLLPMIVFPARMVLLQLKVILVYVTPVISELNAANTEEHAQKVVPYALRIL